MKVGLSPRVALVVAMFAGVCSCQPRGTSAPPELWDLVESLVGASTDGSYAEFMRICDEKGDEAMKSALRQPGAEAAFRRASDTISAACRNGHQLVLLGELRQAGYRIYLWKLTGKDSADEFVVRLAWKDGKLSGFLFQ